MPSTYFLRPRLAYVHAKNIRHGNSNVCRNGSRREAGEVAQGEWDDAAAAGRRARLLAVPREPNRAAAPAPGPRSRADAADLRADLRAGRSQRFLRPAPAGAAQGGRVNAAVQATS